MIQCTMHSLLNKCVPNPVPILRASYVNQSFTSCPDVPVVMSGWSQGAQVVHKAAELVGPEMMASVSSVVTFGDPGKSSKGGLMAESTPRDPLSTYVVADSVIR